MSRKGSNFQSDSMPPQDVTGRIFKTLHFEFMPAFFDGLLNPEMRRPYLRDEPKSPYTVRLDESGTQYIVLKRADIQDPWCPHNQPEIGPFDRLFSFTRPQSTTYCDPSRGYTPSYFGPTRGAVIGVSFALKDVILRRIQMGDGATHCRPYDLDNYEDAEKHIKEYHTSLDSLRGTDLKKPRHYNEVMAGFRWSCDGSSHITVFSDNLQSRLLAQLTAAIFNKMIKKKWPHIDDESAQVPISIYPNFTIYTERQQLADLHIDDRSTTAYRKAISLIKNEFRNINIEDLSIDRMTELMEATALINKINPSILMMYSSVTESQLNESFHFVHFVQFLLSIKHLTAAQRERIIEAVVNKSDEIIGNADHLEYFLRTIELSDKQRERVVEAAVNKSDKLIFDAYQLENFLRIKELSAKQRERIIETAVNKSDQLIFNVSQLKEFLRIEVPSAKQPKKIIESAINRSGEPIFSSFQLEKFLSIERLSDKQRERIIEAAINRSDKLIFDVSQLEEFLSIERLSDKQRERIIEAAINRSDELIFNVPQLEKFLSIKRLSDKEREKIVEAAVNKSDKLIFDAYQLRIFLCIKELSAKQREKFIEAVVNKSDQLIFNVSQLEKFLSIERLSDKQRERIIEVLANKSDKLIFDASQLKKFLSIEGLSDKLRLLILMKFYPKEFSFVLFFCYLKLRSNTDKTTAPTSNSLSNETRDAARATAGAVTTGSANGTALVDHPGVDSSTSVLPEIAANKNFTFYNWKPKVWPVAFFNRVFPQVDKQKITERPQAAVASHHSFFQWGKNIPAMIPSFVRRTVAGSLWRK